MNKTKAVAVKVCVFMERDYARSADGSANYYAEKVWVPTVWKCRVDDNQERIFVSEQIVTIDAPEDFDPRPQMVAALEAEKEALRAAFAARVVELDRQINQLLALEA